MDRSQLKDCQRIVIKVGTNTIMKRENLIDFRRMDRLAFVISVLKQEGYQVALVSSGAVGAGSSIMGLESYPQETSMKQAVAAVGQGVLMGHYSSFFNHYGQTVAQILLTLDVTEFPESLHNVKATFAELFKSRVVPIINENDSVAVEELNHMTKFGDNDTLSAIVAEIVEADLLIILSDVDGLFTDNPHKNLQAQLIHHVSQVNEDIYRMANGKGSEFSLGGMTTKLRAAERMLNNQKAMLIVNGEDPSIILEAIEGNGVGTLFSSI